MLRNAYNYNIFLNQLIKKKNRTKLSTVRDTKIKWMICFNMHRLFKSNFDQWLINE